MNELLSYTPEMYEYLRRLHHDERDEDALAFYAAELEGELDETALHEYHDREGRVVACCWHFKLVEFVPHEMIPGAVMPRLTPKGLAALTVWEQTQQVLPPDGAKLTADKVPPQFREDEDPDKDLLTTEHILDKQKSDWELTHTDLSRNYGPGKLLTRRLKVGRQCVYLHRELKALQKAKTDRKAARENMLPRGK